MVIRNGTPAIFTFQSPDGDFLIPDHGDTYATYAYVHAKFQSPDGDFLIPDYYVLRRCVMARVLVSVP